MGALDSVMAKAAKSALQAVGGSGTYIRAATDGDYDTAFGDISGRSAATETTVSVGPGPSAITLFDESVVEQGDETAIVARSEIGVEPNPGGDKLTWKGRTRRIVAVEAYGSGDQDAAYALLLRR